MGIYLLLSTPNHVFPDPPQNTLIFRPLYVQKRFSAEIGIYVLAHRVIITQEMILRLVLPVNILEIWSKHALKNEEESENR